MNATRDAYHIPQMKASDADRDTVVTALSEHFQVGRLTSEELEERTGRALAARTLGELDALTTDLPAPLATQQPASTMPVRYWHPRLVLLVAIFAAAAIATAAVGASSGLHAWGFWWIIPVALLLARRGARRGRWTSSMRDPALRVRR